MHKGDGAILLDLDGTLTDPKIGITRSIQHALRQCGHANVPDADSLTWCIGPPLLASFEQMLGDSALAQQALHHYRDRFADVGMAENRVYDGIPALLAALNAADRPLYVATSKPAVYATKIIAHFGLADHFVEVCGSELDGARSDKTELIAWICARHALTASTTTMIGDRSFDMIGARNNGVAAIGVTYGYGSALELRSAGADTLCSNPADIWSAVMP